MTPRVREILEWYASESPGAVTNLARLLNSGFLAGTGKLCFLNGAVGFLDNPAGKFAANPNSYDPNYHYEVAISSEVSAYIGSLGFVQSASQCFAGEIPTILNLNTFENDKSVLLATTADALRLGCVGVSLSIKPSVSISADNLNQIQRTIASAQQVGLPVLVNIVSEPKIDLLAEAVQASVQMGAHIVSLTTPADEFTSKEKSKVYQQGSVRKAKLYDRVKHILDCSLGGKRLVVFTGAEPISVEGQSIEAKEIARGGGFGSMVGLVALQQSKEASVQMFKQIMTNFKI